MTRTRAKSSTRRPTRSVALETAATGQGLLRVGLIAATCLGAALSFVVQPLVGKLILPWFGGSASVWNVTLLFFQSSLVAGYAYAHLLAGRLSPVRQANLHLGALAVGLAAVWSLVLAPVIRPGTEVHPALAVLLVLLVTVGLPYVLLAATSPLLQSWYAGAGLGVPYPLYSVSNLGSLVGLVAYPFLLEPVLGLRTQTALWTTGFVLFTILVAALAVAYRRRAIAGQLESPATNAEVFEGSAGWKDVLIWAALAAFPSMLLHAVTSHLCTEVAPVPFLWVLPLALYLVTFVVTFAWPTWRWAQPLAILTAVTVLGMSWLLRHPPQTGALTFRVGAALGFLFMACLLSHGELVRRRPPNVRLTAFYLAIAVGGACGAIFTSLIAPVVLREAIELHGLLVVTLVGCISMLVARPFRLDVSPSVAAPRWISVVGAAILLGILVFEIYVHAAYRKQAHVVATGRDFYGSVAVREGNIQDPALHYRVMTHGAVEHGVQFQLAQRRRVPTMYYHRQSGIAWAFARLPPEPRRVGLVGLGAGTLATYGRQGDVFRFYEISPVVQRMAREQFTFLTDTRAEIQEVLSDARLALAGEPAQNFDLLVLDAFSGDSVPMHLLTEEAFAEYARHLKPSSMVAVHVSNRYADLRPVVEASAASQGWSAMPYYTPDAPDRVAARWMIVNIEPALARRLAAESAQASAAPPAQRDPVRWTDDFSSLLHVWK